MHGSPSSAHLRIRTVASLEFVYLNYHYYRFLRLFNRGILRPLPSSLEIRSVYQFYPWKLSGEMSDLVIFLEFRGLIFFFFLKRRKKNGTDRGGSVVSRRKTGCFAQPDTRNTINPALHVGVPAFRGTRNTRIPPLLNYDDELSP